MSGTRKAVHKVWTKGISSQTVQTPLRYKSLVLPSIMNMTASSG